jgi:hypothetical protein
VRILVQASTSGGTLDFVSVIAHADGTSAFDVALDPISMVNDMGSGLYDLPGGELQVLPHLSGGTGTATFAAYCNLGA